MPTLDEVTQPLANICTTVPAAAPGVCEVCHGRPNPGFATCYSCEEAMNQVSEPCRTVVPVSLYETLGQLHYNLRYYKDARDVATRNKLALNVAALLARFLRDHSDCIRDEVGEWDVITTVPSTSGRHGAVNPLQSALDYVPWLAAQHDTLLRAAPVPPAHNRAGDDGFELTRSVRGHGVLLIDDTYTTGAHAQSAASTLHLGGADVRAILPIGRVITPGFAPSVEEFWRQQKSVRFSFDRCCLE